MLQNNKNLLMESCLKCSAAFVKRKSGAGQNKRRVTQQISHRDFTVLDVLQKDYGYQVSTGYKISYFVIIRLNCIVRMKIVCLRRAYRGDCLSSYIHSTSTSRPTSI